jgi:hypothetical protein
LFIKSFLVAAGPAGSTVSVRRDWGCRSVGEGCLGDLDGGRGAGPAGVEGEVDDHLFELNLVSPLVGQHEMVPQLLDVAACDEGGDL